MSQRRVQIVILCEDRQQEVFARYFLKKRGFNGLFRTKICPPSSQSGEQYVRTQYPSLNPEILKSSVEEFIERCQNIPGSDK